MRYSVALPSHCGLIFVKGACACTFLHRTCTSRALRESPQRHRESEERAPRSWRFRLIFKEINHFLALFKLFPSFSYFFVFRVAWLRREKEFHCQSRRVVAPMALRGFIAETASNFEGAGAEPQPPKKF